MRLRLLDLLRRSRGRRAGQRPKRPGWSRPTLASRVRGAATGRRRALPVQPGSHRRVNAQVPRASRGQDPQQWRNPPGWRVGRRQSAGRPEPPDWPYPERIPDPAVQPAEPVTSGQRGRPAPTMSGPVAGQPARPGPAGPARPGQTGQANAAARPAAAAHAAGRTQARPAPRGRPRPAAGDPAGGQSSPAQRPSARVKPAQAAARPRPAQAASRQAAAGQARSGRAMPGESGAHGRSKLPWYEVARSNRTAAGDRHCGHLERILHRDWAPGVAPPPQIVRAIDRLAELPQLIKERLVVGLDAIHVGPGGVPDLDHMGQLSGVPLPSGRATWDACAGAYGQRKVIVGSRPSPTPDVMCHEIGHALDDIDGSGGRWQSDSAEFGRLYDQCLPWMRSDFHRQPGQLGRREFFADAFAAIASSQRPALVEMVSGNTRAALNVMLYFNVRYGI